MTELLSLSESAWLAHESSRPRSGTAVGVAIQTADNYDIYAGCNIELEFRLGLHAEVSAIANMLVCDPGAKVGVILVAAERSRFTPCGSCMDWIMQVGGASCIVIHEDREGHVAWKGYAKSLMPFYPE